MVEFANRILSLNDRMLLTEWTLLAMSERDSQAPRVPLLRSRLMMPSGRGIDLLGYREHVREIVHRHRTEASLREATETEVLLFLEHTDGKLNARTLELYETLAARLRERQQVQIPELPLFEALQQGCLNRPVDRKLRRLITEEHPWTEVSNGQAA